MMLPLDRAIPPGAKRFIVITRGPHEREPSGLIVDDPSCNVRGHVYGFFDKREDAEEACRHVHRPPISLVARVHLQVYDLEKREVVFDSPP